jgi:hypothetical protein
LFRYGEVVEDVEGRLLLIYAPPSRFAYSSSMRSSYNLSASFSCSVFSVCVALATLCVDVFPTLLAVAGVLVDFSLVDGMGTGMLN